MDDDCVKDDEASSSAKNENSLKSKQKIIKKKFIYGNYDQYYGYRTPRQNIQIDPRLEIFKKYSSLFKNKDILDIGCNNGLLTLLIVQNFDIKSMHGIDIDKQLIGRAKKNLKNHFKENVTFTCVNYVLDKSEKLLELEKEKYDLILCLSVTKWIHLNFGDDGIKFTFKRIFRQLRTGGSLILEAQNWNSYKKRKNLTPEIYKNYKNLIFRPCQFNEYLLGKEIGFSEVFDMESATNCTKGFTRPIKVYTKGQDKLG